MQRGSPRRLGEGLLFFYFSFCSVARWDATFWAFRGIGEGGTAFPRGAFLQGRGPLRPTICEGATPPLHSTLDAGAPREHGFAMLGTRVTFPSRGKSPKARQGLRPLESPEGDRLKSETLFSPAPPAASRNPLDRDSDTTKDRFATLSLWANRSCFFPLVSSREHSLFSICGSAGLPPRMLEGLSSRNQYR